MLRQQHPRFLERQASDPSRSGRGDPTNDAELPRINDSTFAAGKTGFWTAGDTVAYFADTKIEYTARVPLIQTVIAGVMKKNPRLLGLKVYALKNTSPRPVVVADGKDRRPRARPAAKQRRMSSPTAASTFSSRPAPWR